MSDREHEKTKRNLNWIKRSHRQTGADMDYLMKLDPEAAAWMEHFLRQYYDGKDEPCPIKRREAYHRKYMAKCADAQTLAFNVGEKDIEDKSLWTDAEKFYSKDSRDS